VNEKRTDAEESASPPIAQVRAGSDLEWERIEPYVRHHVEGLSGHFSVNQFTNGTANLTYLITFGERQLVLRRPPFGTLAPGAHDMKREFKVLSHLGAVYDRAPQAYLFCGDHSVAGADFFVMEYRDGVIIRDVLPTELAGYPNVGQRVGAAFVDAVAELHLVDPNACGLADIGRPEGFVERQVRGWSKRWDMARPDGASPLMDELGERFAKDLPMSQRVSILHNDLHLGNCQFDPTDPDRVASIFDWDMATVGDPLIDFGSLLAYWRDETDFPSAGSTRETSGLDLQARAEATARYAERTDLDVSQVDWYHAFARWRIAIIMQQLYNRWAAGDSSDSRVATFGDNVPVLAEAAQCLLDGRDWSGR
jgi:aminoglycoside phosphotransferase (APT) family kinase protein